MSGAPSKAARPGRGRRTPLGTRGEPMIWLTAMALALCLAMILGLLWMIVRDGLTTFWPGPVERVTLANGDVVMGVPTRSESFEPPAERAEALRTGADAGAHPAGAVHVRGRPVRTLYRVGNKEALGQPYRWVERAEVASVERPRGALLLERTEWGVWIGMPDAILLVEERTVAPGSAPGEPASGVRAVEGFGERPFTSRAVGESNAGVRVREEIVLAEAEALWPAFERLHPLAADRRAEMNRLRKHAVGRVNGALERERLRLRAVEMRCAEGRASASALSAAQERYEQREGELYAEYAEVLQRIDAIAAIDARYRLVVRDASTGRVAPRAPSIPDDPMLLSQVVRAVPANDLGWGGRLRVYGARWREFVTGDPREANTEGGVAPVIFGTVTLTILLSVVVSPLGAIAAIYLREYARQGPVTSLVRIAVNNLAGVPSIVYGVFGLGFFCYTLGAWVDGGPARPWAPREWFTLVLVTAGALAGAVVCSLAARRAPGVAPSARQRAGRTLAVLAWFTFAGLAAAALATSPYFDGFFRERLPNPTFGSKGILWSSLTLALLTLPVVIVATEEAIGAAPRSLREASFGCGASQWQTVRRVVLPRAMPGVMTGMILAMARGAGEVAPLMLVGAVKQAPELPITGEWPFVHLERSFMHLGFHIYDLAFQSPDSEAARPAVWTTTLLLIVIIVLLNITAIGLRARLRRRFLTGAF